MEFDTECKNVIRFNVWDPAGNEIIPEKFYEKASCAIIMFDVTSPTT